MNTAFHIKIRKEVNIHEKSSQVHKSIYFNISVLLSNVLIYVLQLQTLSLWTESLNEHYNLCLILLPACWFLIYGPTPYIPDTNWIILLPADWPGSCNHSPWDCAEWQRMCRHIGCRAPLPASARSAIQDWGPLAALQSARAMLLTAGDHRGPFLISKNNCKLLKLSIDGTLAL